jgi:hypothetical protein
VGPVKKSGKHAKSGKTADENSGTVTNEAPGPAPPATPQKVKRLVLQ